MTSTDSWLGLLNDARIAIGTRIQISEDNHEELAGLPDDDPRSGLFHVYDWLTSFRSRSFAAWTLRPTDFR